MQFRAGFLMFIFFATRVLIILGIMKCKYCGNEIADGKVYCENCGRPVQMVPDYNPLEDEILPEIVSDDKKNNDEKTSISSDESQKEIAEKKKSASGISGRKFSFMKVVITLVIILAAVAFILIYYFSPSHQIELGNNCMKNGDYTGALSYFLASSNEKSDASLDAKIGDCYLKLQDKENATDYFNSALIKDPENYDAFSGLVEIAKEGPDYSALSELEKKAVSNEQKELISKYIVPVPVFSKAGGDYSEDIELTLECDGEYDIYYTLDGTDPERTNGILYKGDPISIKDGVTIVTARCVNDSGFSGDVVSNEYIVVYEVPEMPVAVPDGGSYSTLTQITLTCDDEDAVIYYAWDDDNPSVNSTKYSGPIDIPEGQHVLSAVAINKNKLSSPIYRGSFTYLP